MMGLAIGHPLALLGLLLLPLIVVTHFYLLKDKKNRAMQFANFDTIRRLTGKYIFSKKGPQLLMRLAATAVLVLALAGPTLDIKAKGSGTAVMFALDNSGSMLARDVSPNRLEAAKAAVSEALDTAPPDTLAGLVTFGGLAFIESMPTQEHLSLQQIIGQVQVSQIPGTAIGDAVRTASTALLAGSQKESRQILLLTDGQENFMTEKEIISVMEYAQRNGIGVHIMGFGSEEGSTSGYVEREDARFQLNSGLLEQSAVKAGGTYVRAQTKDDIKDKFEAILQERDIRRKIDLSFILFAIGLLLLFIEWNFTNYTFSQFP